MSAESRGAESRTGERLYVVSEAAFVERCNERGLQNGCSLPKSFRCRGCRGDGSRLVLPDSAVEVKEAEWVRVDEFDVPPRTFYTAASGEWQDQ